MYWHTTEKEIVKVAYDESKYRSSETTKIMELIKEHSRYSIQAVRELVQMLDEWIHNGKKIEEHLKKLTDLEEKGNRLKMQILVDLSKAAGLMLREDFMRGVLNNDKLIDGAEIAGYNLSLIMNIWVPTGDFAEKMIAYGDILLKEVTKLREAIIMLTTNNDKAIELSEDVRNMEKQLDIMLRDLLQVIYTMDIPIKVLMQFKDFINAMEEIANYTEESAENVLMLALGYMM